MKKTILLSMKMIRIFVVGMMVITLMVTYLLYPYFHIYLTMDEKQIMESWQKLIEYVEENTEYYERVSVFALSRDRVNKTKLEDDMKRMENYDEVWSVIAKKLYSVEEYYDPKADI